MKTKPYIYIIDDSIFNLKSLQKKLTDSLEGFNIRTFNSTNHLLMTLKLRKPDLILADYVLNPSDVSKMNGNDLLLKIRELSPQVPVIMYSSSADSVMQKRLIDNGATDFIALDENFISKIGDLCKQCISKNEA